MVVVAIIGIITAIAIPLYNRYKAKSYQEVAVKAMRDKMKAYKTAYAAGEKEFTYIRTYDGKTQFETIPIRGGIGGLINGSRYPDSENNLYIGTHDVCYTDVHAKIENGQAKFNHSGTQNIFTAILNSPLCHGLIADSLEEFKEKLFKGFTTY